MAAKAHCHASPQGARSTYFEQQFFLIPIPIRTQVRLPDRGQMPPQPQAIHRSPAPPAPPRRRRP
eukprot:11884343-Karenia_brevis.AAC.1